MKKIQPMDERPLKGILSLLSLHRTVQGVKCVLSVSPMRILL